MGRLQHFGYFFSRGFGPQGWGRDYQAWNDDWTRPDLYAHAVRDLERAGFDLVVIEAVRERGQIRQGRRRE